MKFYETKWFMWVTLIFFAPVGIFVLWKYKHYGKGASVALTVIFSIVFLAALGSNTTKKETPNEKPTVKSEVSTSAENETNTEIETKATVEPTPTVKITPTPPPEPIEFGSGNFVAGEDFPAGKYDIVWVSGYGNVSSSNLFSGGINAIMGDKENAEKEYKNIKLPKGTELKISSVKVKLIPK